jgi:hypothetical protein
MLVQTPDNESALCVCEFPTFFVCLTLMLMSMSHVLCKVGVFATFLLLN